MSATGSGSSAGATGTTGAGAGSSTGGGTDAMSGITNPSSAGRGGGRGSRGGRGGQFGGRRQPNQTPAPRKFTGKSPTLEGYIYDLTTPTATAAAFYDTTMEIAELVGRTYTKGNYTKLEIESLTSQDLDRPKLPMEADGTTASTDEVDLAIFKQEVAAYVKGADKLKENRQNAFSLIWGQCSETLRAKVQASADLPALNKSANVIGLLQAIRSVMLQFQTRKYQPLAILESKRRAMTFRQGDKSVEEYYRLFKQKIEATEHNGGCFGYETSLVQVALPANTSMKTQHRQSSQKQWNKYEKKRCHPCSCPTQTTEDFPTSRLTSRTNSLGETTITQRTSLTHTQGLTDTASTSSQERKTAEQQAWRRRWHSRQTGKRQFPAQTAARTHTLNATDATDTVITRTNAQTVVKQQTQMESPYSWMHTMMGSYPTFRIHSTWMSCLSTRSRRGFRSTGSYSTTKAP
ncbi:hypothetical protein SEMRO_2166_G317270.1 [Seminavis robusta]|uniref:Retrotransposon gag domain-containing protein n=1 Tax=Seminavis robusta TaxID=568900 RepID=A0A9N8F030_9STRA|nr:hypothetical protein SEMRO_2166_G317270.1 [Seminavis robusta]|eukprot:Sro2166_g317270.1 n/a (462) ;mRNA; r:7869-9254